MRSFGATTNAALLGALAVASTLSSTGYAQECQASATQCATNTNNVLMHCDGGSWSSVQCDQGMTCMTMGAMIHCMLMADNEADSSVESATPTSSEASKSEESSAKSEETHSTQESSETHTTSGAKGFGREVGAFVAVGAMVAGMVALF
ncbi:hypothetical protein IWW48_003325 [Coemansia sp. RSA 1200]|nr:hypothetical protein IWW48_003325 [Coemansia sp. RSA 1200]